MRTSKTLPRAWAWTAALAPSFSRRAGIRRLLLSQGRGRLSLGGATAGRGFQSARKIRKINETQKEVFFNKVRAALVDASGQAAGGAGARLQRRHRRHSRISGDRRDKKLLDAGAVVTAYDPAAMERAKEVLPPCDKMQLRAGIYEAAQGCRCAADSDRLEGVRRDRPDAAQPGDPLPDRD